MIGPQKISQWMQQISQVESFGNYLESKFDYLEELNQGKQRYGEGAKYQASNSARMDRIYKKNTISIS